MDYLEVPVAKAYELLNPGGLVLLCTRGKDGRYDLAPVAWNCPLDYEPVSKCLLVVDPGHRSHEDLCASGEFALALPTPAQRKLVQDSGSVSGREKDKYAAFGIAAFPATRVDALIPEGVAAWLECRLIRTIAEGSVAIVLGEVLAAQSRPEAWRERLHYVREGTWYGARELG